MLQTGIPGEDLPCKLHCGCRMTCVNRLNEWHHAGAWQRLHEVLVSELRGAGQIDWPRVAVDASLAPALSGGEETGPDTTDGRKPGSKHRALGDGHAIPLATTLTSANTDEVT